VNGHGEFVPAHELGGTRVFVPIQFLAFSGVYTDAQAFVGHGGVVGFIG
jgi:hypothetical protein